MLKRLWLLLSTVWAIVFLGNGATKVDGIREGDILLALAPLALGWLLARSARFIVTGSPAKPRVTVYRGR